jgi:uncharacterized protein involved in exopolysaccharide biosynthesis
MDADNPGAAIRREISAIGDRIRRLQSDDDAGQADALEQEIAELRKRREGLELELTKLPG